MGKIGLFYYLLSHQRYKCTKEGEEIILFNEVENANGTVSMGETFNRTDTNRYGFTCTDEGQYDIRKDSNDEYILPLKCLPRGE